MERILTETVPSELRSTIAILPKQAIRMVPQQQSPYLSYEA